MVASIPDKAFYTAARYAAELFSVNADDVFGNGNIVSKGKRHAVSHARIVCVAALRKIFPRVSRAAILDGLCLDTDPHEMWNIIYRAKSAKWWDEQYVAAVSDAIRLALVCKSDDDANFGYSEDRGEYSGTAKEPGDKRADRYVARNWRPARIILAQEYRRPRNITAAFLGDPEPGRREHVASLHSPYYRAGNESRLFNRGGGRGPRNDI